MEKKMLIALSQKTGSSKVYLNWQANQLVVLGLCANRFTALSYMCKLEGC